MIDVDENQSLWLAGKPPYEPLPSLEHDERADVVIIGGGFTGVSTAWHLAKRFPERRIVLLEARQLANGASGRNGGLMLNGIAGVRSPDAEHARRIYDTTQRGMQIIDAMITEHGLDVPRHREGALDVFTDPRRADEGAAEVEVSRAAGIPLTFLDAEALRAHATLDGAAGAIFDPAAGHLDGVAFLRAMRPVLVELGVGVYEQTPVLRIEEGATHRVETANASIRADAIVLATGAYTPQLGYFGDRLFALQSHVVGTGPHDDETWARVGYPGRAGFADDLDRIAYGCRTTRGEFVFGGGSNAAYTYQFGGRMPHGPSFERSYDAIERRLRAYLPASAEMPIVHRWSGPLSITMSRMCAIGVRGDERNVYYAFGFSGHGIVMANLAGCVLSDMIADTDEHWRDLPFYQPKLHYIPPEPFRWLGYQGFTRVTGRSPRRR